MNLSGIRRRKLALAVTTALVCYNASTAFAAPLAPLPASQATLSVTGAASVDELNAVIASSTATDLTIDVASAGIVTGGDLIIASVAGNPAGSPPTPSQYDGAIIIANAGKIGALAATGTPPSVTDSSGIAVTGLDAKAAANSATITNSGLVTGSINAAGMGGDAAITNTGTVYGAISASGYGNVAITNGSGSTFYGSDITAEAYRTASSAAVAGVTSTTFTSGNAIINQMTDALRPDGTTRADISALSETGSADVTVAGKAGFVTSIAGSNESAIVSGTATAIPDAATTTARYDAFASSGASRVVVASTGDVSGIYAAGAKGGSEVSVAGKVGADGIVALANATDSTSSTVDLEDATGPVSTTQATTTAQVGGMARVVVTSTGSVGAPNALSPAIIAAGDAGAIVSIDGRVTGTVDAIQQVGPNSSDVEVFTFADGKTVTTSTQTYTAGNATISIGATGSVSGDSVARSNGNAAITLAQGATMIGNATINAVAGANSLSIISASATAPATGDFTDSDVSTATAAGGNATYHNAGLQLGSVDIVAAGGATVTNSGQVTGRTNVAALGGTSFITSDESQETDATNGLTTVTEILRETVRETITAADITGAYSGVHGQQTFGTSDGSITQTASGNSTLIASGTVFGALQSIAGWNYQQDTIATHLDNSFADTTVTVTTSGANAGTTSIATNIGNARSTSAAGTSMVNIAGLVTGDATSSGNSGSILSISGKVNGAATSRAFGIHTTAVSSTGITTIVDTGKSLLTTLQSNVTADSATFAGGTAAGNITGKGQVTSLSVSGVSAATARVEAGASVTNAILISAGAEDSSLDESDISIRDRAADTGARSLSRVTKTYASLGAGHASLDLAGTAASASVEAYRGDASATMTGKVAGDLTVTAQHLGITETVEQTYAGKSTGALTLTRDNMATVGTYAGGKAVANIASSATALGMDVGTASSPSIGGNLFVAGLAGADISISKDSYIAGAIQAVSQFEDTSYASTPTLNAAGVASATKTVDTLTAVGGAASVNNGGTVGNADGITATGLRSAAIVNSGKANALTARSLFANLSETIEDNDPQSTNIATKKVVTTTVATAVGGAASISNSGTTRFVNLFGATGTLTNSGTIGNADSSAGVVTLGEAIENGTSVITQTISSPAIPTPVVTPALFSQSYTVEQNGKLTGSVLVTGADFTGIGGKTYQTSNVTAAINLNTGSETTGTFTGENNTHTTVNVNGGKLTLSGETYQPASATNAVADWSAGLVGGASGGSFRLNINEGTAQIAPIYGAYDPVAMMSALETFGLNGDVTVGTKGTLIVGTLVTPANKGAGASIYATTPTIEGADLNVGGNLASSGTVAVGLNGALVRTEGNAVASANTLRAQAGTTPSLSRATYTTPDVAFAAINSPSSVTVAGNLNLGGKLLVYVPRGSIFTGSESQKLFTVGGTITNTALATSNLSSQFIAFSVMTSGKDLVLNAARQSYATAASTPNAVAAAIALDKALPGTVQVLVDDAAGKRSYASLAELDVVQDVAEVISELDWAPTRERASAALDELASASIYGSLANLRQNIAFEGQLASLVQRRNGEQAPFALWMAPIGNFPRYSGTASGAAKISASSYGMAGGLDLGLGNDGAFGFGFGYTRHNVAARNAPNTIDADTYTLGAYYTQGFGPLAVNARFAYGFSKFGAERNLALLARKITSAFDGSEWNGSLALSYALDTPGFDVVPYGELALRRWSTNGFTEEGGAGIGLKVAEASKTVFNPSLGLRLAKVAKQSEALTLRPFANLSYTFQGNAGTARTVGYLGDLAGHTFTLNGVNPKGYASIGTGLSAILAGRINLSLSGSYSFGSDNNVASIRSVIGFRF